MGGIWLRAVKGHDGTIVFEPLSHAAAVLRQRWRGCPSWGWALHFCVSFSAFLAMKPSHTHGVTTRVCVSQHVGASVVRDTPEVEGCHLARFSVCHSVEVCKEVNLCAYLRVYVFLFVYDKQRSAVVSGGSVVA